MAPKAFQQHFGPPEEHPGIPIKMAGGDITLRFGQLRLFMKTPDGDRSSGPGGRAFRELNVAIAGFGPTRLDADHHQMARPRTVEGGPDHAAKRRRFAHYM